MELRILKSEKQYREAIAEVERLAEQDPDPNSADGIRLELLAKLVEDYELERFKFAKRDPVDAIEFRMQEQGLRQKDIAEILGGKNRASEILARKRQLTLPMIRALHERLRIPAELLIREPQASYGPSEIEELSVAAEVISTRGWLEAGESVSSLIRRFLAPVGSPVMLKHTLTFGANAKTNRTHVWLWLSRVRQIAEATSAQRVKFDKNNLTEESLRYVARLSWMDKGPRLAMDFLEERGIAVVIEPHLPSTHIDGAALLSVTGSPIIGLSLREDRLDNFWFVLLHELVHVWKHLDETSHRAIADENIEKANETEAIECEANERASEILLPKAVWRRSDARLKPSAKTILALAEELQISPAIVAGRVRFERRNYALYSGLVGYRQVRMHFPEVKWG